MSNTKTLFLRSALAVAIIGILLWFSLQRRTVSIDSGYRFPMGTVARIMVTAENERQANKAIAAAFDKIYHIEAVMSNYDPDSQLSQVNREAFGKPIQVDEELFEVLTAAKLYSRMSDGGFDVTIGPVIQLWRKANDTGTAPTPEAIAKAKASVGYENLILDAENRTVRFAKEGMFVDLGGIAKGYAIDKAIESLQDAGIKGGMVDIGGDLRCFGRPVNAQKHWLIGLQDPHRPDDTDSYVMMLRVDDRAVATSGDYRRFVMIGDEKHSHIINPTTADSAQDLSSVTIIAPTAMAADALATAVSVMGDEKGLELIEKIENTEAILIASGKETTLKNTSGVETYIEND